MKKNWTATQANLILQLNPVLRGWGMYHRHVVSKARFTSIDAQVWRLLWRWALRRHPSKGKGWIRQKYFQAEGNRTWVFAADTEVDEGIQRQRLFRTATIPIVRHIKIRGSANPFDPAWTSYLARRRTANKRK